MNNKMNRRSFLKRMLGGAISLLGLSGGSYYYAKYMEPSMLSVQEEKIISSNIPPQLEGLRVLQFSDTHLGFHYDITQFERLVHHINKQQCDLLLFTGDLFDAPNEASFEMLEQAASLLDSITAPLGKFWIYGNHDHGGYGTDLIATYMEKGGFTLLQNQHKTLTYNGEEFIVSGLDDVMLGKPDISRALPPQAAHTFTMLLCHEPDYVEHIKGEPFDIQLSGHSHGGQIQIPFLGHMVTPPYAKQYVEGWHTIRSNQSLYVSRGLGTTRLPYRFLCKPEFTVHTLTAQKQDG
ncbi:metallophosphoesterase [Pontibacillus salicampi]|uniref:Metallophosphoesterase n=1 Tax=Pontibacillus salicampi TaxID=1449801 RepID=A0ABV6LIQ7_9BACI